LTLIKAPARLISKYRACIQEGVMNYRMLAYVSLGLWLATVIVAAVFFVRGQTTPSADGRRAIQLAPAERDLVLGEMRAMLGSVQGVVQGVQAHDLKQAAAAARASGMSAAVDLSPGLMAKLPLDFKNLGLSVHKGFDGLALAAERGASDDQMLNALGQQLAACVGCHASYRLDAAPAAR
jgi:cytochrome c556